MQKSSQAQPWLARLILCLSEGGASLGIKKAASVTRAAFGFYAVAFSPDSLFWQNRCNAGVDDQYGTDC